MVEDVRPSSPDTAQGVDHGCSGDDALATFWQPLDMVLDLLQRRMDHATSDVGVPTAASHDLAAFGATVDMFREAVDTSVSLDVVRVVHPPVTPAGVSGLLAVIDVVFRVYLA